MHPTSPATPRTVPENGPTAARPARQPTHPTPRPPTTRAATATASCPPVPSSRRAPPPSRRSGGQATGDVEPAEQADPVEDPNDQPTPKGAAYEVEITKDGQALKVFLDSSFHAVETQQDAG